MTSAPSAVLPAPEAHAASLQEQIQRAVDELMAEVPNADQLSANQRRGIIARYDTVLEANFIYWMTATYLSVMSKEARTIILDNLHEEVGDCHPEMLRRFTLAADAMPTDTDILAVARDLTNVRLFMGRMSGVKNIVTMAFFEGFIQKFMTPFAEMADRQGSKEQEYTIVHGLCDITHTQELFRALAAEIAINPPHSTTDLFEGVDLLGTLIRTIVHCGGGLDRVA
ncbi:MAG: iron-containing redox enzyme family protein [Chloroflexi bacterium]|nr:iron-containing redox enzyme family protein [Chloroflexota bacterium]